MSIPLKSKYLCEITVNDSQGNPQTLEVHEVVESGYIFAVDATFLDQVSAFVNCPYSNSRVDCFDSGNEKAA